jgi:hypothetical protein
MRDLSALSPAQKRELISLLEEKQRRAALKEGTLNNPDGSVLWTPHEKQREFLRADEDEVLYGGAAGGGKSDAMLIAALGLDHGAIRNPRYRSLVIRQTMPQLRELIDRARVLYPAAVKGAEYHEQAKEWRFPSGAKLIFGYCDRDADVYQYQGQEFQFIGVDELGHYASPFVWQYLGTRLRSSDKTLKCRMRATCNPGPKWIREYWGFDVAGSASIRSEGGISRRFIPSRLDDNPSLSDTNYRNRLLSLPEAERAALLDGRWDVINVPGAIYADELNRALERITSVPVEPTLQVHTYWDLGVGDATAIWFVQYYGMERRVVDFYEASGEGLPHYVQVLKDKGYQYGIHFAPHDIAVREFSSGKSRKDVAKSLGIDFQTVPNLPVEDGIHAARMALKTCYFDANRCEAGLLALRHYRRDYNQRLGEFKPSPVHDWSSHAADAFRYMAVASEPSLPSTIDYASYFANTGVA